MSIIEVREQPTRVINSTKLLENIRKAMLVYNNLQSYVTIFD